MMKYTTFLMFFAAALISVLSCTKDKVPVVVVDPAECPDTISFANSIMPMINMNCSTSGCHDVSASGGYVLTNYSEVEANATIILNVIRQDPGFSPMPQGANQLPQEVIQQFNCWIKQGKLDN
jgi:hypothetical protein